MPHALIIEDEFLIALSVEESLQHLGYTTFDLASGLGDALEAAELRCPDLIVVDYQLADGTGIDAIQAICADKSIAVVFVTASGPLVRMRVPGALIVDKPCAFPLLKQAVAQAVERPFRYPGG